MRTVVLCAVFWMLLPTARGVAAPETCPDVSEEDTNARRGMAKDWFTRAEESEAAGDRQAAVRRYACSLKLVPHPSTAYNLGTAAEKSGDLSLAVDAFKMYLDLAPDAPDRAAVQSRVARLEARVAELRQQIDTKPATPSGPVAGAGGAPGAPGPGAAAPPPADRGAPGPREESYRHRMAGWILLGGATAALGAGVALNVIARSKMDDCYARYRVMPGEAALSACHNAKSFAYGSYGLFAGAGALGVAGLTFMFWKSTDDTAVAFVPGAGGGLFVATGRF